MVSVDPRFAVGIAASVGLGAAAVWILFQRRLTPEERERRRRMMLNKSRRTVEALVTEATEELIHYQYELRGVQYFASQDVRGLRSRLPDDPGRLVGPSSAKYDPKNPANSMLVCEDWSGLPEKIRE